MSMERRRAVWTMWRSAVPLVLIIPSLIWVVLDKAVWEWDPADYGKNAIELSDTLIHFPSRWVWQMLATPSEAAPGILWFGQFFVPLGRVVGSIDAGLLLSIWVVQGVSLLLIHRCLLQLSDRNQVVAFLGCAVIASAPLFVGISQQFYVEPLQLLAVAWFVLILSAATRWSPAMTLGQLLAAVPLALLAKVTSPMYCLVPGLVALWCVGKGWRSIGDRHEWSRLSVVATIAVAIPLNVATALWYWNNITYVMHHVAVAFSGPVSALFGQRDSFLTTLTFWLQIVQHVFFMQPVALTGAVLFGLGVLSYCWGQPRGPRHFTTCCVCSTVQILVTLCAFSLSDSRDVRFLLPLLPYVSVTMAWSVAQLNVPLVTAVATFMVLAQLTIVHAQSLGLMSSHLETAYVRELNRDPERGLVVDSIVERTCSDDRAAGSRGTYWNIIGESRAWLNVNTLRYTAAKRRVLNKGGSCSYSGVGGYFVVDDEAEWERILSLAPHYYIATEPDVYPPLSDKISQAINGVNVPLRKRVETSGLFERQAGPQYDPGVAIFRRIQQRRARSVPDALAVVEVSMPAARQVRFGDKFELSGAVLMSDANGLELKLAWRCLSATVLDHFVAVHFVDQKGTILAQSDFAQDPGAGPVMPGEEWVDRVLISRRKLAGASNIAIALYKPGAEVELIDRGPRDWNGRRLLLDLDADRGGK
jgi:hypothetical protein